MNNLHHMKNKTPEERRAIAQKAHATRRRNKEADEQIRQNAIVYRDGLFDQINILEKNFEVLQRMELFSKTAMSLTNKTLLSEEEIVESASKWKKATGIYFLVKGSKVVYVGQSVHVYSRIASHQDKEFDSFAYIPCDEDMLDKLESLYIHVLRPERNGNHSDGKKHAPLNLEQILKVTK